MTFDPKSVRQFEFVGYDFFADSAELRLKYALDDHAFTERVVFPGCAGSIHGVSDSALDRCFRLVHLLAGISYYKAAIPETIIPPPYDIDATTAAFVTRVYHHGLGEFAYRNDLDVRSRFKLTSTSDNMSVIHESPKPGVVVALGGGKDSLVSVELLKKSGRAFSTIAIGQSRLIRETAETTGVPHIAIERHLDSHLFELNKAGAYNGHVPITAILGAILLSGAWLYGYQNIIMSNERSASEGNTVLDDGFVVNHQYSKSIEFERDFQELISSTISRDLDYFSLLRPLSELQIAREFSRHTQYHPVFSSCNRNFSITHSTDSRWCCDCPKCRFVFLMMATVSTPAQLVAIFGNDLLQDETQRAGFAELLGLDAMKPFECVGEIAESRAAMAALGRINDWQQHSLVRYFAGREDVSQLDLTPWLSLGESILMPEWCQTLVESHDWA